MISKESPMPRPGSHKILVAFLFLLVAVAVAAAQTQTASLHPGSGLVWQRTSPTVQNPDGPVLYQLLFSTSGIPNQVAKFDTNPRHLTNSLLSDDGSNVHVGNGNTFAIGNNGIITFAAGQTFPGTGSGTVTSVGLSAPADFTVGSAVTTSGNLSFSWVVAPTNASTASAIVKRDASGNFSANTVTLSGNLALPNTASSTVGVLTIGNVPFLHNFTAGLGTNLFVGANAGNLTTPGAANTGVGTTALDAVSGSSNTAVGFGALGPNTSGSFNVAVGRSSGVTTAFANANTTGSNNTFIGYNSGPGTSTQLNNATAIGANALVSTSNSLVLGDGTANVGIGTPTPGAKLDVVGTVRVSNGTATGTTIGAIQAGTATLGTSLTQENQFTVTFPSTFASTPHVIVTARAADPTAPDVFAVSTRSVSTTQFVINIIRLDTAAGWGQNLQLDWFAWQ
jgi:hypothetical protein